MKRALGAALILIPRVSQACAMCFGGADGKSGFAHGIFWGVVILMTAAMGLVGGIGYAIWSVEQARAGKGA